MRVEPVGEDDWPALRDLRLRALRDSPDAFGSTLQRELGFTERHWRMRLRSSPTWWALDAGGAPGGMVTMIVEPGSPADDRHVVGLWVAPEHRRSGFAWALLEVVRSAARADGARTVSLWVVEDNVVAADLYVRFGFERSAERQPLPRDPARAEERYVLAVGVSS